MTQNVIVRRARRALPLLLVPLAAACDGPVDPGKNGSGIEVPGAYVFESRFEAGVSSVSYTGQTVRNLLVQDLKMLIGRLGSAGAEPITVDDLLALYEHQDAANLATLTRTGTLPLLQDRYSAITTGKSLVNGPISDALVIGYGRTADELLREWFQIIADNSQDAAKLGTPAVYTNAEGVDLSQMIEKVLHGAVAYSRGTGHYLSTVLDQDNTVPAANQSYTRMEHFWDEAFGYFGATRDYFDYSDAELAGSSSFYRDSNGDGRIDLRSEYNFAFAKNAGKRDRAAQGLDFTREIFDAFLRGRTAIVNQEPTAAVAEQRNIVARVWEEVIAATVVHYINSTLDDVAGLTSARIAARDHVELNKHWAEMRAFTINLQYNPFRQISNAQLQELAGWMGTSPPYFAPGTAEFQAAVADLERAKALIQSVYGFSAANVAAW